jgi:hypothetical protein
LHEKYKSLAKFPHEEFSSKTYKMNEDEIRNMLKKGMFI